MHTLISRLFKRPRVVALGIFLAISLIALPLALAYTQPPTPDQKKSLEAPSSGGEGPVHLLGNAPTSFAPLVDKVVPAVVNIAVTQDQDQPSKSAHNQHVPPTLRGTPFEKEFRKKMLRKRRHREMFGAGSGVIIDPSGIIVTNNHVIDGADRITVSLTNGKEFSAKVMGVDTLTDIAVIKVEAPTPLPFVSWGDSRKIHVGDWILAAGNPFGLGSSVTVGIVSARGRNIGAGPFDDFLQLDAPINPGNSGGPSFNLEGQVVALNTAIVSPTGGSVGIGFGIPSEIVIPVVEQLKSTGHIERGWLGVTLEDNDSHDGVKIVGIERKGPARAGGLKIGDYIQAVGDNRIETAHTLIRAVAAAKPGAKVKITVRRQKEIINLDVTVGRRPKDADN